MTARNLQPVTRAVWRVPDYDLASTLCSGQVFRWQRVGPGWEGVVSGRWVALQSEPGSLAASLAVALPTPWVWLEHYLQLDCAIDAVLATFPRDTAMQQALAACPGLRLLRQDPWECLASFILSSTKRIVQIQQVIARLCQALGEPVVVPTARPPAWSFPGPERVADASETILQSCRAGFRAPYLREAARRVAAEQLDLTALGKLSLGEARRQLMELPGVGPKIADCVLLFAYGRLEAFPIDVWMARALREAYFDGRRVSAGTLTAFATQHFGPCAGYAQQYLFHYRRIHHATAL